MKRVHEIAPGILVETYGGACPYQAEGTIDGFPFYFRARGEGAELCIDQYGVGEDANPVEVGFGPRPGFLVRAKFARWPEAGDIDDAEAFGFIERGALVFRYLREERSELAWNPRAWAPEEPLSLGAQKLLGARMRAFAAYCNLRALLTVPYLGSPVERFRDTIEKTASLLEDFHHYETWQRAAWGDPTVADPTKPGSE